MNIVIYLRDKRQGKIFVKNETDGRETGRKVN